MNDDATVTTDPQNDPPQPRKRRNPLRFVLELIVTPIVLFEEWGWEPLQRLLGRLARFRLIERLEEGIATLPPYPALATFAMPAIALFPVKLGSLYLMANGHVVLGIGVLIGAKAAGTAILHRELGQPAGDVETPTEQCVGITHRRVPHARSPSVGVSLT